MSQGSNMASPNHQWLQLPNVNQWGEAAFDSSYSSKAGSLTEFPFDESLFASDTPSSFNTTPPTPNNASTQNYNSQHSSRRQPQFAKAPRSESSSAGSTAHDTSHDTSYGHISVCTISPYPLFSHSSHSSLSLLHIFPSLPIPRVLPILPLPILQSILTTP